ESESLEGIISFEDPPQARALHLCRGTFNVEFIKNKEIVFRLNYAHGEFSAPLATESQEKLLSFLDSLGLPAEDWAKLEREQSTANQTSLTTPEAPPPTS
ncbi:hypothetical protein, partial [Pelagicoccus mobilis]|uniref:hypothetical protein n=1 Tax=Pelagicoccus mobilis TaxID=415221 RepID=UPI001F22C1EA